MAIVGVFIRENEAFLAYPKNGSTRQLNTILPPGVGEDTFFTDQESFRRAFKEFAMIITIALRHLKTANNP